VEAVEALFRRLEQLNEIGAALSQEKNLDGLLEKILIAAKTITQADGGTLYLRTEEGALSFAIMRTDSLGIALGGTTGKPVTFYPIHLRNREGEPNYQMVAAYAALTGKTVNITDAYSEAGFDFSGTRNFDRKSGYRSKSFLTVPMRNHESEIIGVLQLINRMDAGEIVPFSEADQRLAESLASQAAIAITNRELINQLENLFESFIQLINTAIDEKSPYTGGHCQRVPELTMMLAEAVNETKDGPLADFVMSDQDRYELRIAGLLHDCGKVTTPVHVVDKATKLQTLFDRIGLIDTRFEVLKRDARIEALEQKLAIAADPSLDNLSRRKRHFQIDTTLRERLRQHEENREFLRHCNIGAETMSAEARQRVRAIGEAHHWTDPSGNSVRVLSDDEMDNLSISHGTLTAAEREIINHHIVATIKMLEALPWPSHLRRVPEYAGGHHERMDGKGYPRRLRREQMSVQARVMGIADIFEALTARDRPYKRGKTLSESLAILGELKQAGHVDQDLFEVFVRKKVYLRYAQKFLDPAQLDEVHETQIPGYKP
jgi:HD-GYP domain-containing protein (c-di-GMP phosphodiesterase class II)